MGLLLNWLLAAVVVFITAYISPGVELSGFMPALVAALVLGLANAFIKPILLILTLPINVLTLGLFTLVINALLVMLTSAVVPGFLVSGFWPAIIFSIVLFFVNFGLRRFGK